MCKLLGTAMVMAGLAAPAAAFAQMQHNMGGMPKHEFGVDLAAFYSHTGSGCSTNCGTFNVGTPVDVRIGFATSGPLSFEPRFTLAYITGGGGHLLSFNPDINILYRLGPGSGQHNLMGAYVTGGIALAVASAAVSGSPSSTATQFSVNAGVGTRMAYESGAFRPEAFFRYNFENKSKSIPSSYDIGARIGLSLWH